MFRRLLFVEFELVADPTVGAEDVGGLLTPTREWDTRSSRSGGAAAFLFKGGEVVGR